MEPRDEASLSAKLEAFEQKSSDQIVVATIPSLDGEAIEPYANRLFRAWKLGQAGENNGVLLLVARNDRKMRIEVGYGLEGTLTDLLSGQIIRNTLVPAFRAGNFSEGITKAADDIITVLGGDAAELEARFKRNERDEEPGISPEMIFFLLWIGIFAVGFGGAILPPMFGQRLGANRYRWLGMDFDYTSSGSSSGGSGWSSGGGSGWSGGGGGWSSGSSRSSGGGFSGRGGSSGGGGASGGW